MKLFWIHEYNAIFRECHVSDVTHSVSQPVSRFDNKCTEKRTLTFYSNEVSVYQNMYTIRCMILILDMDKDMHMCMQYVWICWATEHSNNEHVVRGMIKLLPFSIWNMIHKISMNVIHRQSGDGIWCKGFISISLLKAHVLQYLLVEWETQRQLHICFAREIR